jgi:hypothetical protein
VSEATQASYVTAAIAQWTSWGFHGPIMFYTMRDLGTDRWNVNDNMGMVDRAGRQKPVFASVRRQLQAPREVRATASVGGAEVTWSPPSWDYGRVITGYRVLAASSGATATVSGSARSATFALGTDISETFSVVPLRGSDPGVASAPSNVVTPRAPNIVPGVGSVAKPQSGTVTMRIPVVLDAPSAGTVSVEYTTASFPPSVNARPGVDYESTSGLLAFVPGQTVAYLEVTIRANPDPVANDMFLVVFSNPRQAHLGGYFGLGIGVIVPA